LLAHIYAINIHSLEKDKARLAVLLDEERREKLNAIRQEEDALRSLAGGLLMRRAAGGKPVRYTEKGKPFVEGGPFFSVSHSGDYAAAVVCPNAPVGIDIENTEDMRGGNFFSLAKRAFHPEELAYFAENPERGRFYEIWTQKEAFVKMRGEGLGIGLHTFNVLRFSPRHEADGGQQTAYTRIFRDVAPYLIAVCSAEPVAVESIEVLSIGNYSDEGGSRGNCVAAPLAPAALRLTPRQPKVAHPQR
jgi:4'-phosphopantetheinyl transferase